MPDAQDKDWLLWTGQNLFAGFLVGTANGFMKAYWVVLPPNKGAETYKHPVDWVKGGNIMRGRAMEFVVISGLFSVGTALSATARGRDDVMNTGVGGAAVGMFLGGRTGTINSVFKCSVGLSIVAIATAFCVQGMKKKIDDGRHTPDKYTHMYPVLLGDKREK